MDEVRARVKADTQKAAAREAAALPAQSINRAAHPAAPPQPAKATEPTTPVIRPSFEMYSPETDAGEAEKSDVDHDDDDDEDEDDDSDNSVDDIAPDTNFDLPPPLIVSPLKANPLGGRVAV